MTGIPPPPAAPAEGARRVRELTSGEHAAAACTGAAVAGLGLIGFANSFARVAAAAQPWFGPLAPTVPLGIDLGILAFSALDLLLARLDMRPRWLRLIPWGLTAATVCLNVSGEPSAFARVAHAVFPLLWVTAVEIAAHVARIWAGLAAGTAMDRIRPARWLLAPLRTAGLWRRMVLWEIRSYPAALDRERDRLLALTALQDRYGPLAWRWRAPRRARALYRLGELAPAALAGRDGAPGPGLGAPAADLAAVPALRPRPVPAPASAPALAGQARALRSAPASIGSGRAGLVGGAADERALARRAEADFAGELAAGRVPSLRQLKAWGGIGQAKAQRVAAHLAAKAAGQPAEGVSARDAG